MWVRPILTSCATSCGSTIVPLSNKSRKHKLLALDQTHIEIEWNIAWLNECKNESLKFFRRFRYSPWVVVEFVVFRGSCHYLHHIDRHISRIELVLGAWFPVTRIIDIPRFHFIEFISIVPITRPKCTKWVLNILILSNTSFIAFP